MKEIRPFGFRDKIGYMFGDFGNDFMFLLASFYLMTFYTDVLGIPSAAVGTLFLVARVVDAFTDVTMGRIVDSAKPAKDGRFRCWIRRIAGPVAIASFLMYQSSMAGAPTTLKYVYMYVTYLLWGSVFYTAINIPYGSMASAISNDPDDRSALSTFRSVGATLANMLVSVVVPQLLYNANGEIVSNSRFTLIAGVFSVCAIICYILCYTNTVERVKIEKPNDAPKENVFKSLGTLLKNRALIGIIGAAIFLLLAMLLSQSVNQYLFRLYFKNTAALSTMNLIGSLLTLAIATVTVPIAKKFGKKEAATVATAIAAAAYFALFVIKTTNVWVFVALISVAQIGTNFFNLVIWANITDIIDYHEVKTGQREDGTIYAVYSFSRKLGQALAGGLGGYALQLVGYDSAAAAQGLEQTQSVLNGIYNVTTVAPAVCLVLVTLSLAFIYPLTKKVVNDNVAELKRRREG